MLPNVVCDALQAIHLARLPFAFSLRTETVNDIIVEMLYIWCITTVSPIYIAFPC